MFENVLTKQGKLHILLDTEGFDELLAEHSKAAEKLLEYSNAKMFDLFRSPFDTRDDMLRRIAEFKAHYDENGNLASIIISREKSETTVYFDYRMRDIENIAAKVYGKESLTEAEIESVLLVFIQARLHQSGKSDLMVTTNDIIIKNRFWFESHFPGLPVNIATIDEALEFMDLFAKFRGTYYIGPHFTCNRGVWRWYLLSFETKVPAFQLPWSSVVFGLPLKNGLEMLQGFSNRFTDLLRAVDEIGFQYYLDANNDTLETMVYHLNYFITLVTGIFDSLAKLSVIRYDLKIKRVDFDKQGGMNKITLRRGVGKDFLKQVTARNQELSKFIDCEQCFIELFYPLREKIVHRERLQQATFDYSGNEGNWRANSVEIPVEVAEGISQFDKKQEHEFVTEWGVYVPHTQTFVEPFHFVKASARKLTDFCNNYFELLNFNQLLEGYSEIRCKIEKSRISETSMISLRMVEIFEKCHLGF